MKKELVIVGMSILLLVVGLSGCVQEETTVENRPPVANFVFAPELPIVNETVYFIDTSTDADGNIISWLYSFHDVFDTSPLALATFGRNVEYVFDKPGNYTVELTVADNDGTNNKVNKTVTVSTTRIKRGPTANFTYSPSEQLQVNQTITFTDTSTEGIAQIINWMWYFGDDSGLAYENTTTHTYNESGFYTVHLRVRDTNGRFGEMRKFWYIAEE